VRIPQLLQVLNSLDSITRALTRQGASVGGGCGIRPSSQTPISQTPSSTNRLSRACGSDDCRYSEASGSGQEGQSLGAEAGLHNCLAQCSLGSGAGGAEPGSEVDNREPELNEATLFVGDLAKEVNELDLRRAFSEHGQVLSVDIKRDRETRSSLGYGFVQYASHRCVRLRARPTRHGQFWRGRVCRDHAWPLHHSAPLCTTPPRQNLCRVVQSGAEIMHASPCASPQRCVCPRSEACQGKRAMQKGQLGSRTIRVGWAQKNTNLFVGDLDSSVSNEILRRAFGAFGPLVVEDTFMKVRVSRLASRRLGRIERTRPSALPLAREDPRTASRAAALRACCSALLSAAG
jgi:RNA recognition motif-containing protein